MIGAQVRDRYLSDFKRVEATLPGRAVSWMQNTRRQAFEKFAASGFPTTRDEDWKYTSVAFLGEQEFVPSVAKVCEITQAQISTWAFAGSANHLLVFVDGYYAPGLSKIGAIEKQVLLTSTADLLVKQPELLAPLLQRNIDSAFAALNTAFMTDGMCLYLPAGSIVEDAIHVLYIATSPSKIYHHRNIIVAEDNTQATVIEHYVGINDAVYFNNAITSVDVGNNATIEHYKLQQEGVNAFHIANISAIQNRDSRFNSHSLAFGSRLARNDISTRFQDSGGECEMNGLYVVGGCQHIDHHTCIDHAKPRCTSREYYRGVLSGASRAVFNGKVIVQQDAQKTDAQQANHNLLLSKDAEIDTKPELQIYADDVKCAHGATIGQLDDDMMFYLRSRGISNDMAHGLLTYAFAHDIVDRIKFEPLRLRIEQILMAQLPQGEKIKELL